MPAIAWSGTEFGLAWKVVDGSPQYPNEPGIYFSTVNVARFRDRRRTLHLSRERRSAGDLLGRCRLRGHLGRPSGGGE